MAFTENIDNIFLVLGKSTKKHDKAMIGFAVEQKPKKPGFSVCFSGKKRRFPRKFIKNSGNFKKGFKTANSQKRAIPRPGIYCTENKKEETICA